MPCFIKIIIYTIKSCNHVATLVTPVSALTKGEIMRQLKSDDSGFTGLEAAIVLIAFVVVAAVFSYVVLGAGFFTTQKSQETVYKGVEQASTNIQMIGNVYGIASSGSSEITSIEFSIGLAPGAPTIDLTKMRIMFSTPTTTPVEYTYDGTDQFTVSGNAATCNKGSMAQNDQCKITMTMKTGEEVGVNTKMTIEIRPSVGASLPFTKTSPPTITATNVLY
jgi:archaeal flagellin FlaB